MSTEFERTALLALPAIKQGSTPEAGLNSWSRPFLINTIRSHGVDVVVSRGAAALDVQKAEVRDVVRPEYSGEKAAALVSLGTVGLWDVDVVRSIVRPVQVDTSTPFLNPNEIRTLARNKFEVAKTVLRPAGVYHRESVVLHDSAIPNEISDRVSSLTGDFVVAKPVNGQRSRGVLVGNKPEIATALLSAEDATYMVEEKLDFSHAFPQLRAINESEQHRLDTANDMGVNKELRMYYFGNGEWDTVGRVAQVGETDFSNDKWLYLDLDSIPDSVREGGAEVVSRLKSIIGNDEFNIALDWVYASSASQPEATWQVMELNAAEPQLVQISQNPEVGRRQHEKLAGQISRIALS